MRDRGYTIADAPGYAANEHCAVGRLPSVCELERGVDVPVVVIDYTGRPVPNANIALNLGCGHIPDQRRARTDERGRAVLHDIVPSRHDDIWIEAPFCHRGTTELRRTWRAGDPPVAIDAIPGITVRGRVQMLSGEPVRHALVGPDDGRHRPFRRTDSEGRFHLEGLVAWTRIEVVPDAATGAGRWWFRAPPDGTPIRFTLGAPTSGIDVLVRCVGPDGDAAAGVRVVLVRSADGLTASELCDESGEVSFGAPPGDYLAFTDGELGAWGRAEARLTVDPGGSPDIQLSVPRNPTVSVDGRRVLDLRVAITTRRAFRRLELSADAPTEVPVPVDERESVTLRGVAPGRHTVVVADSAHVGKVFTLFIGDAEARTLDVILRALDE